MSVPQPYPLQELEKIRTMLKKLFLMVAMAVYLVEAAPGSSGRLNTFDEDNDLEEMKYEYDLDGISKLLDEYDESGESTEVNTLGYNKKTATNKGSKRNHDVGDLKKIFKTSKVHDQGAYDDDDVFASVEGFSGKAVGVKGNEDRKYRKGTKTRGFHRIHHKDEYKKDKVFYNDDEVSGTIKKVGAKGFGYKLKAGADFGKGHFHHDRQKGRLGERAYLDKGHSDKEFSEYEDSKEYLNKSES